MEAKLKTSTFIVRMWSESPEDGATCWRGSIDDVARSRRLYFTNLGAMCEFIVEQRHLPALPSKPPERQSP